MAREESRRRKTSTTDRRRKNIKKKSTHTFFLTSHQPLSCLFGGEEVVFAQTCTEMYVYTQLTMCKVQYVCVCVQTH